MRRVLVTGAAGLLGGAVARRLAGRSDVERVVATDLRQGPDAPGIGWVRHDIREPAAHLLREHQIDTILHHAYVVRPPRHPETARSTNVDATRRLLDDAGEAGVERFVYPSSTTVYGAWPGSGFHSEDEPPKPLPGFTYSEHKVAAERVLLSGPARPTVIVLRGCVVVGGGAESFILSSLGLPLIPLPSGADPPMQFLHIDDYVTAVEAAAAARRGGIFNVAGTGTIRLQELIEALGSRSIGIPELLLRRLIDVSWRLRLQSRSPAAGLALVRHPWLASIEKIRSRLGWEPRRSSEEAIGAWAAGR